MADLLWVAGSGIVIWVYTGALSSTDVAVVAGVTVAVLEQRWLVPLLLPLMTWNIDCDLCRSSGT